MRKALDARAGEGIYSKSMKKLVFPFALVFLLLAIPASASQITPINGFASVTSPSCGVGQILSVAFSANGTPYWITSGSNPDLYVCQAGGTVFASTTYVYLFAESNFASNYIRDLGSVYSGDKGSTTSSFVDSNGVTINVTKFTLFRDIVGGVSFASMFANGRVYAVIDSNDPNLIIASEADMNTVVASSTGTTTPIAVTNPGSGAVLGSCATFDLPCLLSNVTQYVFIPTQASVDNFKSLTLASSSPFSYVYDVPVLYGELFNTSTTTTLALVVPFPTVGNASSSLTLISAGMLAGIPMAGTVRTLIGWIMWLLLAQLIYYQLLRSHNKEQK